MAGKLFQTRDCQVIQQWAEARYGQPALMTSALYHTSKEILCIMFPDVNYPESYTPISWEALCARLEHENLVFLYQNKTESGNQSQYCRFVKADVSNAIATEEPAPEPAPISEERGLYQSESLHTPQAKGVRIFRHPNLITALSGGLLVRLAIITAFFLSVAIFVVYVAP